MTKARPRYAADFETTTDPEDCRVWAYGIAEVSLEPRVTMGNSLDEFMSLVSQGDCDVYFHNLAFDGTFIMDWLFRNGYSWTSANRVPPGQFSTLISGMGAFYSITLTFWNGSKVTFKDSLKKLPMPVSAVARAFDLEIAKGDLDYHTFRPVGHVLTGEEKHYLTLDVSIIAQALYKQFQQGMTRLTVGSDSLADYQKIVGKKHFTRMFPVLSESMDSQIRLAYRGGFTYADTRFKGKRVGPGAVYDVNSLYPYVMREKPLPYGMPKYFEESPSEDDDFPLFIVSITFTAELKKNHIPCIQIKGNPFFNGREYQRKITEPTTAVITSVDLRLWESHYDLDILSWNGGYEFHAVNGFFNDYIDKWMTVKAEHTGGLRTIAKLHLNSLYGKFATNPDITPKVPIFEDGRVKLVMGEDEKREPVYTAVGCFITAYARELTITAAQANYATFAYADTDSLHLLTLDEPQGITVDPHALGAWKHEYNFTAGVFAGAKQYSELKDDGEHETHIAGLPDTVASTLTLDDMVPGREFGGVLKSARVPGGVVLTETTFTL